MIRVRSKFWSKSRQPSRPNTVEDIQEPEKAPFLIVKRIREGILDEVFKPGDRLGEIDLAEKFEGSRSPVREALLTLEKEGTVVMSPYKGAVVKPLSSEQHSQTLLAIDWVGPRSGLTALISFHAGDAVSRYKLLGPFDDSL
jgi:DNA-binding FadR family transcriptional regulator